jgi:hypothetical protein
MARKKILRTILLAPNVVSGEGIEVNVGTQEISGRRAEISIILYDLGRASETEQFIRGELMK